MYDEVSTVGITELDKYPVCKCKRYFKQCIETDVLYIPSQKPCVESIDEVNIKMCVDNIKVIKTILGPKLIVCGTKKIKIMYTANNCEQSVHSAHWTIPFCEFVLIDERCYNKCYNCLRDVFIGVEHVCVGLRSSKCLECCSIYIICPQTNLMTTCYNQGYDNRCEPVAKL